LRLVIGLGLTGLSLYLVLRNGTLAESVTVLATTRLGFVALALASVTSNNLAKAARWKVLLGEPGRRVPFLRLLLAHLGGQMLNSVYPIRLGEVSRAYIVGGPKLDGAPGQSAALGPVFVLGTIALEKLIDMLAYAGLFLLLLTLTPLPGWVDDSAFTVAGVAFVAVVVVVAVNWRRAWVRGLLWRVGGRLRSKKLLAFFGALVRGSDSLEVINSRWALVLLAAYSAWIWLTAVLTNYLALLALGLQLPVSAALLLLVALLAGINLPAAPGQFGVFEYICILALGVFQVPQPVALSYGLLLHGIVLVSTMLPGLLAFGMLGSAPAIRPAASGEEPHPAPGWASDDQA
jgi:uncharacterized protein (TIRG00374 family)